MKIIYSGLESSGKSLRLAMQVTDLVHRNSKWRRKTRIIRPIVSNLKFSQEFEDWSDKKGVPIYYWEDLNDLIKLRDCDVICDEVGTYFDSRMWQDLSLDVRRWLTQGAKVGIEFYGSAQDFAQVDKSFRRLVNGLFHIRKLIGSGRPAATKPPIKRIWGICLMTELDPQGYDEDKKKFASGSFVPSFFFISRTHCEVFDTTQIIRRSKPQPYKHVERECEFKGVLGHSCEFHKTVHV